MSHIKVEIPFDDIYEMNSNEVETYITGKLRDAGIPVIGVLTFQGVSKGTLTIMDEFETNNIIYTWRNDENT